MPTLVIKSFSEALHAKLQQRAAAHGRTLEQEIIHLIEVALTIADKTPASLKFTPTTITSLQPPHFSGGRI